MTFTGPRIFIGVDGSGPDSDRTYRVQFQGSHVHQLYERWNLGPRHYRRGPTLSGAQTVDLADWVRSRIENWWLTTSRHTGGGTDRHFRIWLAGYSRGGAAVIRGAYLLREICPIHCMLLFDAADRSTATHTDEIPSNVRFCFHARRSPASFSRISFGNCGTRAVNPRATCYRQAFFTGTHGALGGVPAVRPGEKPRELFVSEADTPAARTAVSPYREARTPGEVLEWMTGQIREHRVQS